MTLLHNNLDLKLLGRSTNLYFTSVAQGKGQGVFELNNSIQLVAKTRQGKSVITVPKGISHHSEAKDTRYCINLGKRLTLLESLPSRAFIVLQYMQKVMEVAV